MERKTFPLRTVLTVTTGLLLTEPKGEKDNGISDLYIILEHITGEAPFTHTLGRFAEEAKPYLLNLFPELDSEEMQFEINSLRKALKRMDDKKEVAKLINGWLQGNIDTGNCEAEYEVGQINGHVSKNPVSILCEMMQ